MELRSSDEHDLEQVLVETGIDCELWHLLLPEDFVEDFNSFLLGNLPFVMLLILNKLSFLLLILSFGQLLLLLQGLLQFEVLLHVLLESLFFFD